MWLFLQVLLPHLDKLRYAWICALWSQSIFFSRNTLKSNEKKINSKNLVLKSSSFSHIVESQNPLVTQKYQNPVRKYSCIHFKEKRVEGIPAFQTRSPKFVVFPCILSHSNNLNQKKAMIKPRTHKSILWVKKT